MTCKKNFPKMILLAGAFTFLLMNGHMVDIALGQLPAIIDPLYTQPIADPMAIPKFVNPLPIPARNDMTGGGLMTITMSQFQQDLGLLGPVTPPTPPLLTTVWGYNGSYPGPTIVAKRGNPVDIQWVNNLNYSSHPLPVDMTIHWAGSHMMGSLFDYGIPVVPHLHGGHTESASDGLPEQWWTPLGMTGATFVKTLYTYDNDQEAATLWYHDHVLGITRLNVYMGLAGFYLLRDATEEALILNNSLPSGPYEIEVVIQDRMFYPNGEFAYPDVPAMNMPGFTPWPGGPSAQPEFFGEIILVNGKAWPIMDVQRRQYRFRFLNGSDSRFYNMRLVGPLNTTVPLWFTQIGTEDGLLPSPVQRRELLVGPGERYDVVVDFSDPALAGQTIIVRNNARAPFPKGATVNPNTAGQIMAFRVGTAAVTDPVILPATLRGPIIPPIQTGETRSLLLHESVDEYGRLKPMLGTTTGGVKNWADPITETPPLNAVEVWQVYNTTPDAHPIHLHLVAFQILSRQKFTATQNPATGALTNVSLKGQPSIPGPEEMGWKDTAIMYPGEVTTVIAMFDRPGRYVWHCHILSHEDHEMMRPFHVQPNIPNALRTYK